MAQQLPDDPKPEKPARPIEGGTPARYRPIGKALKCGRIRMCGGYGIAHYESYGMPNFDRKSLIEWCVGKRFLWPGTYANTYEVTEAGKAAYRAWTQYQAALELYRGALTAWRERRKARKASKGKATTPKPAPTRSTGWSRSKRGASASAHA